MDNRFGNEYGQLLGYGHVEEDAIVLVLRWFSHGCSDCRSKLNVVNLDLMRVVSLVFLLICWMCELI